MHYIKKVLTSNALPRLLVAALLVAFLTQAFNRKQQPAEKPASPAMVSMAQAAVQLPRASTSDNKLLTLAQSDHIGLLQWAQKNYTRSVRDYTCVFHKQERINGRLKPEQVMNVSFKEEPFSVLMNWQKNADVIDKLLYVEGQNNDKMLVHPHGLFSFIKSVQRDPAGEEARKSSRGTCDQFGFYRNMEKMLDIYNLADKNADLVTECLGRVEVDQRPCIAIQRTLPPKPEYPFARLVVAFDTEYLLPVKIEAYDWQDQLLSRYIFTDIEFNVGLTNEQFTPQHNNL